MVVRGKRGFTPRTFFRASSVPSEMSPKDTWTSEQLHASNQSRTSMRALHSGLMTGYWCLVSRDDLVERSST